MERLELEEKIEALILESNLSMAEVIETLEMILERTLQRGVIVSRPKITKITC